MENLFKVAINDFKLVFRDPSLRFFLIFPLLSVLVVRYGIPLVEDRFTIIAEYIPVLLMAATMQSSLMFGFIYSMVLIDEKDISVAKIYGVLPVSKFWFVIFRQVAPFVMSTLATILMLLVEPFFELPIIGLLFYSIIAGLVAPIMVLFVATVSKNKIEGMTWQKLFNLPVSLPLLAFFVPASYSFLFAILPTHWAYQGFVRLIHNGDSLIHLIVGFIYSLIVVWFLARKFSLTHFR